MSVITPSMRPDETAHTYRPAESQRLQRSDKLFKRHVFQGLAWLCLLLACLGSSWFAFQVLLVPQPREFTPNWQDARWVQAADTSSPVAYFRYTTNFSVPPDDAFVTIAASQVFRLYVNGVFIGSNTADFIRGNAPQTYMYDVTATLNVGQNAIGVRVANADQGMPQVRTTLGVTWGKQTSYYGTGNSSWVGTGDTTLAHPRAARNDYTWSTGLFDASSWHPAQPVLLHMPLESSLQVNPQLYTQLLPTHWLSAGSQQESYFVRQIDTPAGLNNALLRIVATGAADIFINDHLYIQWNGLVNVPQTNAVNYLTTNGQPAPYRNGLMLGIYDITPYLHPGTNVIAVHILAPGNTTARLGLESLKSAMSMDMLVSTGATATSNNPLAFDTGWHASSHAVAGWTGASAAALAWGAPEAVGRPGSSHSFYMPDSNTPRNVQIIPPILIVELVAWCSAALLAFWLLFALLIMRRYYHSSRTALAATSLIFLPALACEAILLALSRETRLAQPFPYNHYWGGFLLAVVGLSALLLWVHARGTQAQKEADAGRASAYRVYRYKKPALIQQPLTRVQQVTHWLLHNWALLPLILISIPMTLYNPAYEPYWQDELSSYYAARWIMTHGYPAFPSGFVYAKGELFSYLMAFLMFIFGTPGQEGSTSFIIPRVISMLAFLVSLPVMYVVGSRLFNRKIAWLATAMLAFSPYDMLWSRQARMYELAQLMVIIVLGLFYWAIQNRDKIFPVFVAVGTLVLAYFSHEEIFIILPSTVICALLGSREGRYGFPAILRKKHWWVAAVFASVILVAQLATVFLSHPMKFGSDQSQRPQIALTTNNVSYYFHLLFAPVAPKDGPSVWVPMPPFIVLDTLLAVAGCVIAFCRRDRRPRYCALFLLLATATLTFVFTMQADRYYYPLLPIMYLLAAFAFWKIMGVFWIFARRHLVRPDRGLHRTHLNNTPLTTRIIVGATITLLCGSVLLTPMLPLSNFNLFLSRVTGDSYRRHFADYDNSTQYINAHKQPGDLIVSVSPAIITLYYVGKVDHFFSMDRALFLIEQNGHMVETTSGSHPLLNQADFQAVLAGHQRIWLITDAGGYQGGATKNGRFVFPPPDFRVVYEGYGSAVYFRSGNS